MSLSLTISESNIDKADNTSKITATLKISSSASWNYESRSGYIMIDGTKYTFSHSFSTGTTTLATKSKTVTHDSDGGGSITVKGYYSTGVSLGNLSTSKTYKLTQIDRTYTIKFNANTTDTVSNMPSSQTKTYGKTLTLSTKVPTRTGYTFKEWNTSTKGTGTSYKPGGSYKANAADTLYAIWTENSYSITYTLPSGYGTFSNGTTSITVTAKYTEASVVPTVNSATGYSFLGFVVNGTTYLPGATIKSKNSTTSITSVTATSSNFRQLNVTIKFYTDKTYTTEYTSLRMTKLVGSSFLIPDYPQSLPASQEFRYWLGNNNYYVLPGKSYVLSEDIKYAPYITKKADRIFSYYTPSQVETSSQSYSLYMSNSAEIGQSYTITTNQPSTKVETGTYVFKYWTTTPKVFVGASYKNVIPPALLEIVEAGFDSNDYNAQYDLYREGWSISTVSESDGKIFYAVYYDTTKSDVQYTSNDFSYVNDSLTDAESIQTRYANFILGVTDTDSDIVLQSNSFVALTRFTLPSTDVTIDMSDMVITSSNVGDNISSTITTRLVGLDFYIFLSGKIDEDANKTTVITISNLKDSLNRDIDALSFTIKPPKVIRDIALEGDVISLFNQNREKLPTTGNNELQLEGDLRLFGTNIYLGENGDEPISAGSSELIRKYEYETSKYGALTGYTGNTVGTLTGDAKFDVVSMTWSEGTPTSSSSLMQVGYNSATSKPYFTLGDRQSSSTTGDYSLSAGYNNVAIGTYSVALGSTCQSTAIAAVALGRGSTASNSDTVSLGYGNTASGNSSTALGCVATASGSQSVSIGYHTNASYSKQFVCGAYNASSNAIFIVGNGTSDSARNNALALTSSGSLMLSGGVTVSNHSSAIGTVVSDYLDSDKSCATATGTEVCSVTLDTGVWLLIGAVRFSANATGIRRANFSTTSGSTEVNVQVTAGSNTQIQLRVAKLAIVTTNSTTVYLNAYQNSGSTLTLTAGSEGDLQGGAVNAITAVRIA